MAPKTIDIHTHGIGQYDTRSGKATDIIKMAGLHGKAGVTAIVPTVYSAGIDKMRSDLDAIAKAMAQKPEKGDARILGAHLEGPFLNPSRAGAQDKKSFLTPTLNRFKELVSGYEKIIKIITIAPELKGALKVIEQAASMGIIVSMGHSEATYAEATRGKDAGASLVTHLFNAMPPMHHREPGLAGFALTDKDIYVELICDGIHVSREILELVFRSKPKERIIAISDSIKGPQQKGGILQGGSAPLTSAWPILEEAALSSQTIALALRLNAERLLWL